MSHKPVLLKEIIDGLEVQNGEIFVDATLGNAGHTNSIIEDLEEKSARHLDKSNLTIIGIDADSTAIKNASEKLATKYSSHTIHIENSYFDSLEEILEKNNIEKIDKILFDFGFRSDQVDDPQRGFSFLKEGPLDMSFKTVGDRNETDLTAYEVVNEWQEDSLSDIIYGFGEENFSRRISKAIVDARTAKKKETGRGIETTTELAEIIYNAVPGFYRRGKIHPATKTFQAIRIAVNSELERIKKTLPIAFEKLSPGGRMATISFHSLEDRIVKKFFKEKAQENKAKILTKKPIIATEEEISENPRSRSAKLRILEKL
jgi:16S rRNA (cytosine1402-N4)-methyltransferase